MTLENKTWPLTAPVARCSTKFEIFETGMKVIVVLVALERRWQGGSER
jgi:hypothetical protein